MNLMSKITEQNKYNENIGAKKVDNLVNAVIENDRMYCPHCKTKCTSGIVDYDLVTYNGQTYYKFVRKCSKIGCKYHLVYYTENLGGEKINLDNVKTIKSERKSEE